MASEPTIAQTVATLPRLFILVGLVVLTQLTLGVYEGIRLAADRAGLEARLTAQQQATEEVTKVRNQLDALAAGVAILAEQGNANAKALLERLKGQGITLRAPQAK